MKWLLPLFLLAACAPAMSKSSESDLDRARRILESTPLIDGHNDLAWAIRESRTAPRDVDAYDLRTHTAGHTDLERLRDGMVGGQFWSVYVPGDIADSGFARVQMEQIDIASRMINKYPDRLKWALTASDLRRAKEEGKVGSLLGLEGGHVIENSLGTLRLYYDLGARYLTLTHNVTTAWADAALDSAKHGGLTEFGKEVVREMNRMGMLVDLSHVSAATMRDALDVSEAPVIFSHSGGRGLVDHKRNVPDSILRRVPVNGGIVMIPFVTAFVSPEVATYEHEEEIVTADLRKRFGVDTAAIREGVSAWHVAHPMPKATLAQVADQVEYVKRIVGPDHVGIGGDFDGITEVVVGLEDVSKYPALFAELAHRGWSDEDMRKLAGENILRVLDQAEQVAARLQKTRPPSMKTIAELDGPPATAETGKGSDMIVEIEHKQHSPGFLRIVEEAKAGIREVSVDEAQADLRSGRARLIDVREDNEWNEAHAKGSEHLSKGIIERDIEEFAPDKSSELILYCGGGYRSILAAASLKRMGYTNIASMAGGWRAWQAAGAPIEGQK
jgi:membrane dipeptidase